MTSQFSVRLTLILFVTVVFAATVVCAEFNNVFAEFNDLHPNADILSDHRRRRRLARRRRVRTPSTGGGMGGELYVNAGGIWPTRIDTLDNNKVIAQGIYGLKGGIFFGDSFELEGSFGYLNHFQLRNSPNPFDINTDGNFGQPSVLGFLYDMNFAWNFGNRSVFGARLAPYVVFGGGGLTTEVRHGTSAFFTGGGFATTRLDSLLPTRLRSMSSAMETRSLLLTMVAESKR